MLFGKGDMLVPVDTKNGSAAEFPSEDLLPTLAMAGMNHAETALAITDAKGGLVFLNPAAEYLFGWPQRQVLQKNFHDSIHTQTQHTCSAHCPMQQPPQQYRSLHCGCDLVYQRNGEPMLVSYTMQPIQLKHQQWYTLLSFQRVVGEQAHLHEQQTPLTHLAHDIKSLLTTILLRTQLSQKHLNNQGLEHAARQLDLINTVANRISVLAQKTIDQYVQTQQQAIMDFAHINLVTLLKDTIEQINESSEHPRLELTAPAYALIFGDALQIERVMLNLIHNALKYSPPDSKIKVTVQQADSSVLIAIKDGGFGVNNHELPYIFSHAYRAKSNHHIQGDGLGLYLSRLIVQTHAGRLWVENHIEQGCTFSVELPLLKRT